jgi:uncharacterized protein involved in exopolysaccharide biosynthesis
MDSATITQYPPAQYSPEEISFRELSEAVSRLKWWITVFVAACTLTAGAVSWMVPRKYTATTILAASLNESTEGKLGGLASLAGMSLPDEEQKWQSVAVLQSEQLTQNFIAQNNLLPVLYAKQWDARLGRWKTSDPRKIPTLWKANRYFKKIRDVQVDGKTGLVTMTITWKNPVEAAAWANGIAAMTNDYLRKKAIDKSERSIAYLNAEAAKTTAVEARQAIFTVMEDEIDKAMLARGTDEYAFQVLDPAYAPEKPSSLPFYAWMIIALVGSSILSILGVFLLIAWSKA